MHLLAALSCVVLLFQQPGGKAPSAAPEPKLGMKLLAAADAVKAGGEVEIAIELDVPKPWHTYHPIVLDTGSATEIRFRGPKGVSVDNLRWPTPSLESIADIEYLELKGKFACLATLHVDKNVKPGTNLTIAADATALECIEACVFVDAKATLTIPVAAENGKPANEKIFNDARGKLPAKLSHAPYIKGSKIAVSKEKLALNEPAEIVATIKVQSGHHIQDRRPGVEGLIPARFFIEKRDGIEFVKPKDEIWPEAHTREMPGLGKVREQAGEFNVRIPFKITDDKFPAGPVELQVLFQYQCCTDVGQCYPPELVEATLRFNADTPAPKDDKQALYAIADPTETSPPQSTAAANGTQNAGSRSTPANSNGPSLPLAIFFGFLGGLVLNIMPCVLPVISIKIMSFVQQGGEDPKRVLRLGLAFCAGIMVWFWLFALLSRAGHVPLQYPSVVIGVCSVLFVFALNLFGVFELTLPGAAAGTLDQAAQREGYPGAFLKGFLATLLGTACTAPFLAGALVFAGTQPFLGALAVFSAAGLGMAAPYLALCANPRWMRFLPKPGKWMITFKQSMGFVLLGTVVWLLWVLNSQLGGQGVVWTVSFLGFLGLAAWMIGKARPTWSPASHYAMWAAAFAVALGGYGFSFRVMYKPEEAPTVSAVDVDGVVRYVQSRGWKKGIPWAPYSPGIAESLAQRGYTVYVDYTASWCVNCQANKKIVLESTAITEQMERLGVIPIEADFSKRDPAMLEIIKGFGRPSVPLNLIYPAGKPGEPLVLDVLLSPGHVAANLDRAGASTAPLDLARLPRAAQPSAAN